jgi:hypothetical protein
MQLERNRAMNTLNTIPSPELEIYDLSDPESWQKMHRPKPNQEISAASYSALLLRVLEEHKGWICNEDFLAIVEEIFGPIFSEADKRNMRGRPKWMNTVDWAKATLTSAGVIYTRSRQSKGKRQSFIVLASHVDFVSWVVSKRQQSGFTKRCLNCNGRRPLGEIVCGERAKGGCGHKFPAPNKRVHRLPR